MYSLVIYFNDLFFEIDKLYSRDMLFPYKVVKNGICSNINNLRYIIKLAVLDDSHTKTIKSMLVDDFFEGLSKTKNLCYMKYGFFNNQSSYNLKRALSNDKYDTVITISKGLSDEDIIDLFGKVIEQNSQNMISLIQEYKSGDDNDIYINSTYRCNSRYAYNYNF